MAAPTFGEIEASRDQPEGDTNNRQHDRPIEHSRQGHCDTKEQGAKAAGNIPQTRGPEKPEAKAHLERHKANDLENADRQPVAAKQKEQNCQYLNQIDHLSVARRIAP